MLTTDLPLDVAAAHQAPDAAWAAARSGALGSAWWCTGELTAAIGTGDRSTWSARCPLAARRKWKADGHERVEQ